MTPRVPASSRLKLAVARVSCNGLPPPFLLGIAARPVRPLASRVKKTSQRAQGPGPDVTLPCSRVPQRETFSAPWRPVGRRPRYECRKRAFGKRGDVADRRRAGYWYRVDLQCYFCLQVMRTTKETSPPQDVCPVQALSSGPHTRKKPGQCSPRRPFSGPISCRTRVLFGFLRRAGCFQTALHEGERRRRK